MPREEKSPEAINTTDAAGNACGQAWEGLITANEALEACKQTGSASLYRQALGLVIWRHAQYGEALLKWREMQGE